MKDSVSQPVFLRTSGFLLDLGTCFFPLPAAILINLYRTAAPDDPFYADTRQLPMGALSTDQLASVIAKEIQQNLIEKSQTGHVAQDAITASK